MEGGRTLNALGISMYQPESDDCFIPTLEDRYVLQRIGMLHDEHNKTNGRQCRTVVEAYRINHTP